MSPFCIFTSKSMFMPSFKKKNYTEPVICNHNNDLSKDWYVFFRFKHEGKIHKFKRREGVNRIKKLDKRLIEIENLLDELKFDLKNGWNPLLDPKRQRNYSPYTNNSMTEQQVKEFGQNVNWRTKEDYFAYFNSNKGFKQNNVTKQKKKKWTKADWLNKYLNKGFSK